MGFSLCMCAFAGIFLFMNSMLCQQQQRQLAHSHMFRIFIVAFVCHQSEHRMHETQTHSHAHRQLDTYETEMYRSRYVELSTFENFPSTCDLETKIELKMFSIHFPLQHWCG